MNEHVDIDRLLAEEAEAAEAQPHVSGTPVRNTEPVRAPSQVYSLRIPVERLEELRSLAQAQNVAPSALMRRWVLDRLDDQTERGIVNTVAESDDHVFSMTGRELREVMELLTARITGVVVKQIEGQAEQGHSES